MLGLPQTDPQARTIGMMGDQALILTIRRAFWAVEESRFSCEIRRQGTKPWLSEQYGLKKLIEHIWKVIGISSTCLTIDELREHLHRICGKNAAFQYALKIVRISEAVGQELLFDPRDLVS